jgi:hypothetical protein
MEAGLAWKALVTAVFTLSDTLPIIASAAKQSRRAPLPLWIAASFAPRNDGQAKRGSI